MDKNKIAVVILHYNDFKMTKEYIDSLKKLLSFFSNEVAYGYVGISITILLPFIFKIKSNNAYNGSAK